MDAKTKVILENSNQVLYCHPVDVCSGTVCPIHNRTDHSMRKFTQIYSFYLFMMMRVCPCGYNHPDPDDPKVYSPESEVYKAHINRMKAYSSCKCWVGVSDIAVAYERYF